MSFCTPTTGRRRASRSNASPNNPACASRRPLVAVFKRPAIPEYTPKLARSASYAAIFSRVTELLSDIAIQRELGSLTGWTRRGTAIVKTYQFRTFPEGIAFIGRVAEAAETVNHHPDID